MLSVSTPHLQGVFFPPRQLNQYLFQFQQFRHHHPQASIFQPPGSGTVNDIKAGEGKVYIWPGLITDACLQAVDQSANVMMNPCLFRCHLGGGNRLSGPGYLIGHRLTADSPPG